MYVHMYVSVYVWRYVCRYVYAVNDLGSRLQMALCPPYDRLEDVLKVVDMVLNSDLLLLLLLYYYYDYLKKKLLGVCCVLGRVCMD